MPEHFKSSYEFSANRSFFVLRTRLSRRRTIFYYALVHGIKEQIGWADLRPSRWLERRGFVLAAILFTMMAGVIVKTIFEIGAVALHISITLMWPFSPIFALISAVREHRSIADDISFREEGKGFDSRPINKQKSFVVTGDVSCEDSMEVWRKYPKQFERT